MPPVLHPNSIVCLTTPLLGCVLLDALVKVQSITLTHSGLLLPQSLKNAHCVVSENESDGHTPTQARPAGGRVIHYRCPTTLYLTGKLHLARSELSADAAK